MDARALRSLCLQIIQGYSETNVSGISVFIKHLDLAAQVSSDIIYEKHYKAALNKKIPTEKEKLEFLYSHDLWSDKRESEIRDTQSMVDGLKLTKSNLFLVSQIKEIGNQIGEEQKKLNALMTEKYSLFGTTAESYANKKSNEFLVFNMSFKDKTLKNLFYSSLDFISVHEVEELTNAYYNVLHELSDKNIKLLAVSDFFQNLISLAKTPYEFFGKYITCLSYYQSHLWHFGQYFASLAQQGLTIPESLKSNPDAVMDWAKGVNNAKKIAEKYSNKGGNFSYVGATKEDLEAIGIGKNQIKEIDQLDRKPFINRTALY